MNGTLFQGSIFYFVELCAYTKKNCKCTYNNNINKTWAVFVYWKNIKVTDNDAYISRIDVIKK